MLVIDLPPVVSEKLNKLALSPQGLFIIEGMSLNVGVLPYSINDTSVGIFTPEDELFSPESLNTLVGAGLTIEHPNQFLKTPEGMVGIVLNAYPNFVASSVDGREGYYNIKLKVAIWDTDAIDYIQKGNTELSAGYDADVIEKEGLWFGSPYSFIKTNIRYNHLAIVAKGTARNGNTSKLLVDSTPTKYCQDFSTFNIFNDSKTINADIAVISNTMTNEIKMKSIQLPNGKSVEISDESYTDLHFYLESSVKQISELTDSKTKKESELELTTKELTDSKATIETVRKEAENSKDSFGKYVKIAAKAEKFGVKIDYDKFDALTVMRSALKDKYPNLDKAEPSVIEYLFGITEYESPEKSETKSETSATENQPNNTTTTNTIPTSTTDSKKKSNTIMTQVIDASNGNVISQDSADFTPDEMAEIMAKKRREKLKK